LDVKKRFTEEQIIGFLREADVGLPIKELCRKHGFSEASYYLWRSKFGGMSVPDAKRLKELETENTRLKKLLAEQMLENEVIGFYPVSTDGLIKAENSRSHRATLRRKHDVPDELLSRLLANYQRSGHLAGENGLLKHLASCRASGAISVGGGSNGLSGRTVANQPVASAWGSPLRSDDACAGSKEGSLGDD
jgi:putative transposase